LTPAGKPLGNKGAVQGNLDPVLLSPIGKNSRSRAEDILRQAAGRPATSSI